jgi:DNA-binding MarR family transcriptional regulator
MDIPDTIQSNIGYLTGLVTNTIANVINTSFRQAGLDVTIEQFSILAVLFYKEGVNQQEIAALLSRDKTTIARVIGNMFKKSLLVKVPDNTDRRNNRIYLTQKGKDIQDVAVEIAGKIYMRSLENIPEEQLEIALNVLDRIVKNIS